MLMGAQPLWTYCTCRMLFVTVCSCINNWGRSPTSFLQAKWLSPLPAALFWLHSPHTPSWLWPSPCEAQKRQCAQRCQGSNLQTSSASSRMHRGQICIIITMSVQRYAYSTCNACTVLGSRTPEHNMWSYPVSFNSPGQHDNHRGPVLPNHLPEVNQGLWFWSCS